MRLASITGFVCLSIAAMAQEVRFDYNRSANFADYRTYEWAAVQGGGPTQLMDQNIKRAIDTQLAGKGLRRVESGGDLRISYQAALDREKQFDGWGAGPRGLGPARVTTSTIDVGKLAVNLYDPAIGQLVWRGTAEKTLDIKKDPDKNYQNLEKAMAKLFKNYPPGSGKN
jgi:hypothetical protein